MTFLLGLVLVGSIVILGIVLVSPHRERRRTADCGSGGYSGDHAWSPAFSSGGDSACGTADSSGGDCGGGDGGGGD